MGRPPGFDLNSFENWMPAHRTCNGTKSDEIFELTPLVQVLLQRAASKAAAARKLADESVSKQRLSMALNTLKRFVADGSLDQETKESLRLLLQEAVPFRAPEVANEPLRVTPEYRVVHDDGVIAVVQGPYGIGGRPSNPLSAGATCPICGVGAAFNGARCVRCGEMSDD